MEQSPTPIILFELAYTFGILCFGVIFIFLCALLIYGFMVAVMALLNGRLL